MIEANAKLIHAGFTRIGDNLYIKGDIQFRLKPETINSLPL